MLIGIVCGCSGLLAVLLCGLTGAFESLHWLWVLPAGFLGSVTVLTGVAFLFIYIASATVKLDVPQEQDSPFFRKMIHLYMDAIITLGRIHIHAQGLEKVPADGRFLLVSNHAHDTDPIVLMSVLPDRQLAFISKREVSNMFMVGKLMHKILCQPINRENDREALKTILRCIQLIKDDQVSVGVFPEGYILPHRKLHHFRHGVFKIAQKTKVPIVVCTLKNTRYVYENLAHLRPSDLYMNVLEVIPAEQVCSRTTVELGEYIYNQMAKDLGPELVADPLYEETSKHTDEK